MAQDPIAALVRFLQLEPAVTQIVTAADIYGDALPPATAEVSTAVSLRWTGGIQEPYLPILRPRVEVRCWGTTDAEAAAVWLAVYEALNGRENIIVADLDTRIMSVIMDGGPAGLFDNERNRPYKLSFCSVIAQMEALSA